MKTSTVNPLNPATAAKNLDAAREALARAESDAACAAENEKRRELTALEADRAAFTRTFEQEALPPLLRFVEAVKNLDAAARELNDVIRRGEENGRGIFGRMLRLGVAAKGAMIPGALTTSATGWGLGCAVLHTLGRHPNGSILARFANPDGVQTALDRAAVNAAVEVLRRVQ